MSIQIEGTKDRPPIRTLLTQEILPIYYWHDWLERWQAAEDLQRMEALLHVGFNMTLSRARRGQTEYGRNDRVILYLTIANGWADHYLLRLPTDGDTKYEVGHDQNGNIDKKGPDELRQQLARKSFEVLCLNFFKADLKDTYGKMKEIWGRVIESEQLFSAIQNFFRVEKRKHGNDVEMPNLPIRTPKQSHNEEHAISFLVNLAQFMWEWKKPDTTHWTNREEREKRLIETRTRINAAKPWMVDVLSELGKLDILRKWVLTLDKPCLAKLKEIAMRTELSQHVQPIAKTRLVKNLDEACYVGSKSAWFLKEHALKTKEHARLSAILKKQRDIEENKRAIGKLTGKK